MHNANPADGGRRIWPCAIMSCGRDSSKAQSRLDLGHMSKARYRCPIHHDRAHGAHHHSAQKHHSPRTCGRIVLARIVPCIGVGHENLRSRPGPRNPHKTMAPAGTPGPADLIWYAKQEMLRSLFMMHPCGKLSVVGCIISVDYCLFDQSIIGFAAALMNGRNSGAVNNGLQDRGYGPAKVRKSSDDGDLRRHDRGRKRSCRMRLV